MLSFYKTIAVVTLSLVTNVVVMNCSALAVDNVTLPSGSTAEKSFRDLYTKFASIQANDSAEYRKKNPTISVETIRADDAREQNILNKWTLLLEESKSIPVKELSQTSQVSLKLLQEDLTHRINRIALNAHLITFNSDGQFWNYYPIRFGAAKLRKSEDFEAYLTQLAELPYQIRDNLNLLSLGIKRGMTLPKVVLKDRDLSIEKILKTPIEESAFFKPLKNLPANLTEEQIKQLQSRGRKILSQDVYPAYQRLLNFIRNEYMPNARDSISAYDLPNGQAYYAAQIYEYTTLTWSPERIHQIGLDEVARISKEMDVIIKQLNFAGDRQAFFQFLRTDPQFYAKSPHELLAEASYWAKKADGQLIHFFSKLPRKPYGIVPVPSELAPTFTAGRYSGIGTSENSSNYWVNTSMLDQRPLWALPALTLHEAVPGHHLQAAIAIEQESYPEFRRRMYISAYGEGWALYAERLGMEMDYYETPYHHFGRLVYDMWRSVRLVVDTGIHTKGWTRAQALDYMRANTAISEHEMNTEIDRYISWPGQSLSYKLGELKILELRKLATQKMGAQFDLRKFHDKLLSLGSLPLPLMESEMLRWMERN